MRTKVSLEKVWYITFHLFSNITICIVLWKEKKNTTALQQKRMLKSIKTHSKIIMFHINNGIVMTTKSITIEEVWYVFKLGLYHTRSSQERMEQHENGSASLHWLARSNELIYKYANSHVILFFVLFTMVFFKLIKSLVFKCFLFL